MRNSNDVTLPRAALSPYRLRWFALLLLYVGTSVAFAGWVTLAPMPQARGGHSSTLLPNGQVLVAGGQIAGSIAASTAIYRPSNNTWIVGAPMSRPRNLHTATALRDGRVLVVGGQSVNGVALSTAEIYDPVTNTWTQTGGMSLARRVHTAVLLPDGRVLVSGGFNDTLNDAVATAEWYSPTTGQWTSTGTMSATRHSAASLLLADGRVLATGGFSGTVDRYDPVSNSWSPAAGLPAGLIAHSLTLLGNGKVLLAGGYSGGIQSTTRIYDPVANTWTAGPNLPQPRSGQQAALLPSGEVLLIGGNRTDTLGHATTVRYLPASNSFVAAESMAVVRRSPSTVLLTDGRVLVTGGIDDAGAELAHVEAYDDSTPTFVFGTSMNYWKLGDFTVTPLRDGKVLVTGGRGTPRIEGLEYTNSVERYDPATATWTIGATLLAVRYGHAGALLHDGRVLVTGGSNGSHHLLASGEVYDPAADTWSFIAPASTGRSDHTMHVLDDGRVLVIGGAAGEEFIDREIYDPATGRWADAGNGIVRRVNHASVRLFDGRILVAGGRDAPRTGYEAQAELFDPATETWSPGGTLIAPRLVPALTLLADGRVLMTCGQNASLHALFAAEIYDPATNAWTPAGNMVRHRDRCATVLLPDGRVLVSGGTGFGAENTAEIFDPRLGTWSSGGNLQLSRYYHRSVLLPDGRALQIGSFAGFGYTTELFDAWPQRETSRAPTITAAPANVHPLASMTLSGTGFQPVHSADSGSTYTNRGNLPQVQIRHLATGMLRELPIDRGQPFTNTVLSTVAGALNGLPPGPAYVTVRVNGLLSQAVVMQIDKVLPGPPISLSALAGNGRVYLDFLPPFDNGGTPITGYQVTIAPGGARVDCGPDCPSGIVLTGLTNNTSYTFTVRAVNGLGRSAPSAPSAAITPSTAACNSGPLVLELTVEQPVSCHGGNNGALRATPGNSVAPYAITWSPSGASGIVLGGLAAGSYSATVTDGLACTRTASLALSEPAALSILTVSSPAQSFGQCIGLAGSTVSGGTAPYSYLWSPSGHTTANANNVCAGIHTVAVTDANQCVASASVTVIQPPSAPRNLTLTPGNQQVTLQFDPPETDGGGEITHYRATCGARSAVGPGSPLAVVLLPNGVPVSCSVRAINEADDLLGAETPPIAAVTPFGPASAPPAPTGLPANGGVLAMASGPASDDGGSPVTAYRFTATPGGATADCAMPCAAGVMVTGLTNGTAYLLTVQAINAAGPGTESPPSLPVTPRAPQSITFGPQPNLRVGGSANVSASGGGSGNPVVFHSSTPATCTTGGENGSVLSGVAVGTCTIAANQTGSTVFEPAPEATQSFDVLVTQFRVTPSVVGTGNIAPSQFQWVDQGATISFTLIPSGDAVFTVGGTCGGALIDNVYTTIAVQQDCNVEARFFSHPDAIQNFTLVPLNTAIRAEFLPPLNGGSPILDYALSCTPDGVAVMQTSPLVLTGLTNNQVYRCGVRARNAAGIGPPSPLRSVIPGSTGSSADLSIQISNGANFVNGGAPVVYTVTVLNAGPAAVLDAQVIDPQLPPEFVSASWTCDAPAAAYCHEVGGSGALQSITDLPVGVPVVLRYTAIPTLSPETPISVSVSITPPVNIADPNLNNNIASDGPDIRGVFRNGFE